jgi:hypothetical protein
MTGKDEQQRSGATRNDARSDIGLIPGWAYTLALVVYLGIQWLFHGLAWPSESNPPRMAFQILFPLVIGLIPAFLALLVGYVNRDAGRRGMNRALWTVIVIFVPNGIGFILYFVLRNPIRTQCPACGTAVDSRANYCPRCRHNFHPTCPQCRAAVRPGDGFCGNCGTELGRAA